MTERGPNCLRSVQVGAPGDRLGPALEVSGVAFVPDRTTGTVSVVGADGSVLQQLPVIAGPSDLELIRGGTVLYYNDPGSERAGVIRFSNGSWRAEPIAKYDPVRPTAELLRPAAKTPRRLELPPKVRAPEAPADPDTSVGPDGRPTAAVSTGTTETADSTTTNTTDPADPTDPTDPADPTDPTDPADPTDPPLTVSLNLPRTATDGQQVALRASLLDGTVTRATWNFGDGDSADTPSGEATHVWQERAEPYSVSVTVTAADGRTGTAQARISVRAIATRTVTLSLDRPSGGSITGSVDDVGCGTSCAGEHPWGASVSLTAAADSGQRLASWTGDCAAATGGTCTLTLDTSKSAGATFEDVPDTSRRLTVDPPPSGRSIVSSDGAIDCPHAACSHTYATDTSVTLSAYPVSLVSGWTGPCSSPGGPECTLSVTSPTSASARFGPCLLSRCLSFERLPGGAFATSATIVNSAALTAYGITDVHAAPDSSSCSSDVVALRPAQSGQLPALLTRSLTGESGPCEVPGLVMTFEHELAAVDITFQGDSEEFDLLAYDGTHPSPVGGSTKRNTCCTTQVHITASDPQHRIRRIEFGGNIGVHWDIVEMSISDDRVNQTRGPCQRAGGRPAIWSRNCSSVQRRSSSRSGGVVSVSRSPLAQNRST